MNQNPVPTKLKTSSHLISLPHPTCPHFVVQITELRDSLSVWCGLAPSWLVDRQRKRRGLAGMNDEEQEEEEEDELVKALKESGRLAQPLQSDPVEDQRRPPIGSVAVEWAVAMTYRTPPSTLEKNSNTIATSLFRTNSDVALPMSQRLDPPLTRPTTST
ncbi:hypothetical protein IE53DRAFT_261434 [Violaceomyces palustris]|uniref:Uncharacterized protein n=1 Tax=Violaceomyces palustris TaxID=1673888 RepID=A0ACD0NN22_9BASI|nr:hypothetical protein IE53DRAFT_261434 [Violaceomyces palustris]